MLPSKPQNLCRYLLTDSNSRCGEKVTSDYPPILCSRHRTEYKMHTQEYKTHSRNADAFADTLDEETAALIAQLENVLVAKEKQIDALENEISARRKHHQLYFDGEDARHKIWLEERESQLHEAQASLAKLRETRDSLAGRTIPPVPTLVEDKTPRAPSPDTLPRQSIPPDCRALVKQRTLDDLILCTKPIPNNTISGTRHLCHDHRLEYDALVDRAAAGLRQVKDLQPVVDNIKAALDQGKLKGRSMLLDQPLLEEYIECLGDVIAATIAINERFPHHGCEGTLGSATPATLQLQRVDASLSLERLQGADLKERYKRVCEERSTEQEQSKKLEQELAKKESDRAAAWAGTLLGAAVAGYMNYRTSRKQ
ncbi:hypothetical protein C8Q80DRAFT_351062 [Daedaleopsis nitida]|nr:hypothetical protein C8Q80DRAFT_351062 [Daedaleopsis nitida]